METPYPASLTDEQLAAINAGEGYARCEDPASHVVYHLIRQSPEPTIDDAYIREKLAEAQKDIDEGRIAEWNLSEIKQELWKRLANKHDGN